MDAPVDDEIKALLEREKDITERVIKFPPRGLHHVKLASESVHDRPSFINRLLLEDRPKRDEGFMEGDGSQPSTSSYRPPERSRPPVDRSKWTAADREAELDRIRQRQEAEAIAKDDLEQRRLHYEKKMRLKEEENKKKAEMAAKVKEEALQKALNALPKEEADRRRKEIEKRRQIAQDNKKLEDLREHDKVREMIRLKNVQLTKKRPTATISVVEDVPRSPEREEEKAEEQDPTAHGYCHDCGVNLKTEDDSREHVNSDRHQTQLRKIQILKDMEEADRKAEERRKQKEEEKKLREELDRLNREKEREAAAQAKLDELFGGPSTSSTSPAPQSRPKSVPISKEPENYAGIFDDCFMNNSPAYGGYSPAPDVPSSPEGDGKDGAGDDGNDGAGDGGQSPAKKPKLDDNLRIDFDEAKDAKDDEKKALDPNDDKECMIIKESEVEAPKAPVKREIDPQLIREARLKLGVCMKCGLDGHIGKVCTNRSLWACRRCGQKGHFSGSCPNRMEVKVEAAGTSGTSSQSDLDAMNPIGNSKVPPNGSCYRCGLQGHIANNCTNPRSFADRSYKSEPTPFDTPDPLGRPPMPIRRPWDRRPRTPTEPPDVEVPKTLTSFMRRLNNEKFSIGTACKMILDEKFRVSTDEEMNAAKELIKIMAESLYDFTLANISRDDYQKFKSLHLLDDADQDSKEHV